MGYKPSLKSPNSNAFLTTLQNLDAYKPVTMVFCCVDPAQYINAFDIGNVLAAATYIHYGLLSSFL